MRYDEKEIRQRVKIKQKEFLIAFATVLLLIASSFIVFFLDINNTVSFISAAFALILLLPLYILLEKEQPRVLFSKKICGTNIKEHEYVAQKTPRLGIRARIVMPNTRANRKAAHHNIRASVYLRLENGDVYILSALNKAHVDLYNEGDVLLKYSGTRYPIIISRKTKKQPCPICGYINDMESSGCKACGLKIIKE